MLEVGQEAPGFDLPNADMEMVTLAGYKGRKNLVLYFYPKDDTPGCTLQAVELSDREQEFDRLETVVIGVSRDDCLSHGSFRDKHGITVQLLADAEGEVCRNYGVLRHREVDGKQKIGIVRSTFIIDKKGIVRHVLYNVNPRGHAVEVLNLVKSLR